MHIFFLFKSKFFVPSLQISGGRARYVLLLKFKERVRKYGLSVGIATVFASLLLTSKNTHLLPCIFSVSLPDGTKGNFSSVVCVCTYMCIYIYIFILTSQILIVVGRHNLCFVCAATKMPAPYKMPHNGGKKLSGNASQLQRIYSLLEIKYTFSAIVFGLFLSQYIYILEFSRH